ncbi:MAG: hypothetical protein GY778_10600 [bacterium]|nr:hypothetical protein [bacterium]
MAAMVMATAWIPLACTQPPDPKLTVLHQQIDELTQVNRRLEGELLVRDGEIAQFEQQIETLQALGPDRLDGLFVVQRIELASLTGGADYDGVPGDDGVTVFLRPLDADGHVLKAAGEIIVDLLDTTVPGEPKSLARYVTNEPAELRKLWHGGFMTDHYTIRCPWAPATALPASREVDVKVTFYDFLTGRRFTAMESVKIEVAESAVGSAAAARDG